MLAITALWVLLSAALVKGTVVLPVLVYCPATGGLSSNASCCSYSAAGYQLYAGYSPGTYTIITTVSPCMWCVSNATSSCSANSACASFLVVVANSILRYQTFLAASSLSLKGLGVVIG